MLIKDGDFVSILYKNITLIINSCSFAQLYLLALFSSKCVAFVELLEVLVSQVRHFSGGSAIMANQPQQPTIAAKSGYLWKLVFYDDFTAPNYSLDANFRHPMGKAKWKWDAASNKEIWWEPACSRIVTSDAGSSSVLRVCVFSDWFHRIDRIATRQQFGYGYYECRLRFKGASGMHSAFWLLPEAMKDDPVSPGEIVGGVEVDVVENRKQDNTGKDLSTQGNTALHWGGYGANHKSVAYKLMPLPDGAPSQWASFAVWHFEGGMKWFWNGVEVNSASVWSPMKNSIYFSTEVNESTGWAGPDLASYGAVESPEGYIEIDYCGFWELVAATPGSGVAVKGADAVVKEVVEEAVGKGKEVVEEVTRRIGVLEERVVVVEVAELKVLGAGVTYLDEADGVAFDSLNIQEKRLASCDEHHS